MIKEKSVNYLLMFAVVILLIGNIFFYFNLNEQNSDLEKEIMKLKRGQIKQKEYLENLITFDWNNYQNDKFGFGFKYPDYGNICDETAVFQATEKAELNLGIRLGKFDTCDLKDVTPTRIIIKKNVYDYKTVEEAFYKEFPNIDKSLNAHLGYLEVGKVNAYGGKIAYKITDPRIAYSNSYGIIIFKNNYIIKFSDTRYNEIFEDRRFGDKPVFDIIVSSFYFNKFGLLK